MEDPYSRSNNAYADDDGNAGGMNGRDDGGGGGFAGTGESLRDTATYASSADYTNIPDMLLLNHLCSNAKDTIPETWEQVREWLRAHQAEEVRQAAEQRGDSNMTALHFACRNVPPSDVIDVFLSIAVETVQWPDSFGWLPIHYACACGASVDVIQSLAEAFPESKTTVDRRGRTPLHFALGNATDKPASPAVVALLSSTGAASYADDNGMLPLHYACAYGASEESLYVLTEAYPEGITTQDRRHRTPLHFSLSNAGREASPAAVRLLLSLNKDVVNISGGGTLPLRVLAEFAIAVTEQKEVYGNVQTCLEHLLNAKPDPTADFFTALQSLPEWLEERAVVMPVVQHLLNEKISQRFPTMILILDLYCLCMIIIAYSFNVIHSIERRFDDDPTTSKQIELPPLLPLYIGCGYFFFREVIQVISLLSLSSFNLWLRDPSNWINVTFIFLILYWTILMQTGKGNDERFRTGTALSVIILWVKILSFMRAMLIDFAVFVGGVFYVVQRLVAFLTALLVILVAFAQMFYTIFQQTSYCNDKVDRTTTEIACEDDLESRPFCDFWTAFLSVYTMLLGEVDETKFEDSKVGIWLFVFFMFLVVILLANVLIAIVTDSYKVIQDKRAAIVFWTNRLDFVAEMDAIANGPFKRKLKRTMRGTGTDDDENAAANMETTFGSEFWRRLMDLFEDDVESSGVLSIEFWCYFFLRAATAIIIIPSWLLLGALSAGWLWPPQVREAIFTSAVSSHTSDVAVEDELRKTQVENLKKEVTTLKADLLQEIAVDRSQMVQMKSSVAVRKAEIANEMKHIKRIMTMLFEQQSSMDYTS